MSGRNILVRRVPFFEISGEWFADVLWNYGSPLTVDMGQVARFMATAPASAFVIGRRLDARQRRILAERRGDAEHEMYGYLFPREQDRWG